MMSIDDLRDGGDMLAGSAEWTTVRAVFDELVDRNSADRENALAALDLDPRILQETRDLLAAADGSGTFMTLSPTIEIAPIAGAYRSLAVGTQVGAFSVAALIGRGGHGEVYEAFRHDGQFEQRVALKLLRPEALSQFENFRTERQILASLEHPAIARLVDGGIAPDGRPYMAMEYVDGAEIDHYCAHQTLDIAARLRLFLEVCGAVSYAHSQLVVHGDLKPGNILVTQDGQVKLLDFGIARLIEPDEATGGLTAALSTPAYAAPEQLQGKRATIATDIHALGIVLYELLTGQMLWRVGASPISWASRVLQDEPPLASARLAKEPSTIATAAALRGDLDAILAKALRAHPSSRYETVPALAEDIRRYIGHRPVEARNGNFAYRFARFVRRNAIPVAATAAIAVIGAGAAAGVGWNIQQAYAQRVNAQLEAQRGESLRDFTALLFRAIYDHREEGLHDAGEILDASAERLEREAANGPINEQLVRTLGELYFEAEEYSSAQPFFEKFIALGSERGDDALVAQVKRLLASIALRAADLPRTEALIAEAGAFFASTPTLYARERAELDGLRAAVLRERGQREEAIALLRGAIAQLTEILGPTSLDTLMLQQNLAIHLITYGKSDEAETLLNSIQQSLKQSGRETSSIALAVLAAQGLIAQQRGELEKAVELFGRSVEIRKRVYAPSASLAALDLYYGRGLLDLGKPAEAIPVLSEGIAVSEEAGDLSSVYLVLLIARGRANIMLDDPDMAEPDIIKAVDRAAADYGTDSQYYGLARYAHAELMLARGDFVNARADLDVARPLFEAMGPAGTRYLDMADQLRAIVDEARRAN